MEYFMHGEICVQCGDRGFTNAFVYCVKCLRYAVHRYCLDVIPKTFDEYVRWLCDDCETAEKNRDNNSITSKNRATVLKNVQEISENGKRKKDSLSVHTEEQPIKAKSNPRKKRCVQKTTLRDSTTLLSKTTEENETSVQEINERIKIEESEDKEQGFRENLSVSSAEPVLRPIWKGCFSIWDEKHDIDGITAHTSVKACEKVHEEATHFQESLHFKMLPKFDIWPKRFVDAEPSDDSIALYFFPSESGDTKFDKLVAKMMREELALQAFVKNAELLVFTSTELPVLHQRFQGKYYLWGVFRAKQRSESHTTN
ncbi:hypothetical protein MIMGU_mgv1a026792mg [Erythranthe guttata]|uniref:AIPP2-like SPOC-like domain-containing protein n=1 Tax=Erythranthe guttata TaxID=4155 RepID=A0A022PT75_ERYGU|nr:hypothetical protein MIMGU_mgv1a026792mg [Erythranthe guttata]